MGFEKWKVGTARQPTEARLLPVRDLLGYEGGEEISEAPTLFLGARDEVCCQIRRALARWKAA